MGDGQEMKKRGPYRSKPPAGSVADLILRYRQSPRVLGWAPATRRKNDKILGDFMAENGVALVADLRRGDLIAMRDSMARTPSEANNWMKVIRGLLDYATDIEVIQHNPGARIKRLPVPNPDGFRTWREDEIAAFLAYWPKDTLPHLTLVLTICTGASRADLVRLGWHSISDNRISYRRQKTGALVTLPILPDLDDVLVLIPPGRMTFLETRAGTVRSPTALAGQLAEWLAKAGLWDSDEHGHHLSLHGLRKSLGVRMANAGCRPEEIMAVLGHSDSKSAAVYTKKFDRAAAADRAADALASLAPSNVRRMARTPLK